MLCNEKIQAMSKLLLDDWENVASRIGFTVDKITQIRENNPWNAQRQALNMLDIWRMTLAMEHGKASVKMLLTAAKNSNCIKQLLELMR